MRKSLIISACLHALVLLICYFGLPIWFKALPPPPMIIPVDVVDIGELTNTRVKPPEPEPPKPPAPEPPKQDVKPEKPPPSPEPKPPEQKPPDPKPDPKPPEPKKDELAEILQKIKKPEKKPEEQKKPPQDQLTSVLKNLAKLKPQQKANEKKDAEDNTRDQAEPQTPSLSDKLSISEVDALRRQIQQCWNMPVGAREAENLIVEVLIEVNPDRTVQSAHVVDSSRMASDAFFRAAAESALRALRHPNCTPLDLPPDKYNQWKSITFNFDPRDML
jgi:outer membrane biosynthesis protein TonB